MKIEDYLNSKKIIVNENGFVKKQYAKNYNDIDRQIQIIVNCQQLIIGEKSTIIPRVNSFIGKEFEGYKVDLKKVKEIMPELEEKSNNNEYRYFISEEAKRIMDRAERTIKSMDMKLYYKLIKRSMDNYEICLGRVDEGNLKINDDGYFVIRTIKYISYNLIEHDCYSYIKRIKRRILGIDAQKIINMYAGVACLEDDSIRYLDILANYPFEEMKILIKYRNDNTMNTDEGWAEDILKAKIIDGKELL